MTKELNLDLTEIQPERTRSKLDWTAWKDGKRRLFVSAVDLAVAGIETVRIENPTINFRAQCRQQLDETTEVEFAKHPAIAAQGIDHVFVTFHKIVPTIVDPVRQDAIKQSRKRLLAALTPSTYPADDATAKTAAKKTAGKKR